MKTNERANVEVQICRVGRERPHYAVNVKVNGRSVECPHYSTRRKAMEAAPDLANKYR